MMTNGLYIIKVYLPFPPGASLSKRTRGPIKIESRSSQLHHIPFSPLPCMFGNKNQPRQRAFIRFCLPVCKTVVPFFSGNYFYFCFKFPATCNRLLLQDKIMGLILLITNICFRYCVLCRDNSQWTYLLDS